MGLFNLFKKKAPKQHYYWYEYQYTDRSTHQLETIEGVTLEHPQTRKKPQVNAYDVTLTRWREMDKDEYDFYKEANENY